ncbi:MAG: ECF transporter S component [Eubacterium sp.]|nr:ECF transporter S component [Eubacterium sp.]
MNKKLKKTAVTGLFAAMIFVLTFLIKIPAPTGYVHFGDALVYACAMILGSPWALIAAALGEGLADIVGGYVVYFPATAVVKLLIALPFLWAAKRQNGLFSLRTSLLTLLSGAINIGGYFVADLIIDKSYAIVNIPGNVVQAVGSAVIFIILALAFDRTGVTERIKSQWR